MSQSRSLQSIPVDAIRPSPFQYRTQFDEEKQKQLVDSMRTSGLSTPILVRRIPGSAATPSSGTVVEYELVSGERRWRAAKPLGWTTITAIVEEMGDAEAAARLVTDNEVRADTNILEKAEGYRALTQPPCSMTLEQIAVSCGLSAASSVKRTIDLLDQPEPIRDFLSRDKIGEGIVRFLSRIKSLDAKVKLARRAVAEGWSVRETEKRVAQALAKAGKSRPKGAARAAPQAEYDYNGFHCELVGDEVIITGRHFKRTKDYLPQFIEDYKSALECFLRDIETSQPGGATDAPGGSTDHSDDSHVQQPRAKEAKGSGPPSQPSTPADVNKPPTDSASAGATEKDPFSEIAAAFGLTNDPKKEGEEGEAEKLGALLQFLQGPKPP